MPILRAGNCSSGAGTNDRRTMFFCPSGICQKGFTFLELAFVIFIFLLTFALVLPSFTSIGESKVESEAKRIASIIRYLNDSAQSTKTVLSLKIDLKRKLLTYHDTDGERQEQFESIRSVELMSKGLVSDGEVSFFFGPMGAAENLSIRIGEDKKSVTVALNYLSGRVTTRDE